MSTWAERDRCLLINSLRPESQIKSYIEDALRSSVQKLTLDELFEREKDEIALEVQHQVAKKWLAGYIIVKNLDYQGRTDKVKKAIHEWEINAAQRKRVAAQSGGSWQD